MKAIWYVAAALTCAATLAQAPRVESRAATQRASGNSPATQPAKAAAEQSPVLLCPVTNQPVDKAQMTRFRGKWVYFANAEARQKFEADPLEYADGVQAQWAADKPLRIQVACPVTGEPPDPDIYVGTGADTICFASAAAKQKWLADKTSYEKNLPECFTYQTACGTCTGEIDPKVKRVLEGQAYYFCCNGCAGHFEKDPSKYTPQIKAQIETNRRAFESRSSSQPAKPAAQPGAARQPG